LVHRASQTLGELGNLSVQI